MDIHRSNRSKRWRCSGNRNRVEIDEIGGCGGVGWEIETGGDVVAEIKANDWEVVEVSDWGKWQEVWDEGVGIGFVGWDRGVE